MTKNNLRIPPKITAACCSLTLPERVRVRDINSEVIRDGILKARIPRLFLTNALALLCITALFSVTACSVSAEGTRARQADTEQPVFPKLADPSIKKCIADGYQTEPVQQNGIVHSYLCINPLSNEKCDSWRYFRGECKLTPLPPRP